MHVAHLLDHLKIAGAQVLTLSFVEAARELKGSQPITHSVLSLREDSGESVAPALQEAGASVTSFPAPGLANLPRLRRLVTWLRRSKPDILVTHLLEANTLGPLAARFSGTPTVSTMHSIDAEMRNVRPLKLMLERLALRRLSDQVVAVSTAVARSHRERLGLELLVIPNAVPPAPSVASSERRETRQLWTKGADRLVLITIGRLSEAKAHDDLLHAMALLREVHQLEPVLVIAGAGAERENLEKLAASLDLGEAVRLLGAVDQPRKLLASADLFVSSSRWEGLPLALLEAMAAGLPIVATAVGEVPSVVQASFGTLVPAAEPEAMAQALADLLVDPKRRTEMGTHSQRMATERFGFDAWLRSLLELYQGVAQRF